MIRCVALFTLFTVISAHAACTGCTSFESGTSWGTVSSGEIREASGLAASGRNPGVFWTHNDGPRNRIFALAANGAMLATCNFSQAVDDFEDIALGGGFIYIADIGGSQTDTGFRSQVRILRAPEPIASLELVGNPVTIDLEQVEAFTLDYPDGSYDAETLWFDSESNALYIVTKGAVDSRVYQADLSSTILKFVTALPFPRASGGDISADGSRIALRREEAGMLWERCEGESIVDALARPGHSIPLIGPPQEPNGEALTFMRDGAGYATLSEGRNPVLYFFQAACATAPGFTLPLADVTGLLGGGIVLNAYAVGYPTPVFKWHFKGELLIGETNSFLMLANLVPSHGGLYQLTASNELGVASTSATLSVIAKPNLRVTEVESAPSTAAGVSTADWWELTNFESQPVNLSGWRFNDNAGGLTDPFVLPQGTTIAPRESIVFVEGLTGNEFRDWWGIPASVQVIPYTGSGLGLGAGGDGIRLWNNLSTDPLDTVDSVNFNSATDGVSFNYNPVTRQFGALSQLGVNGAFRSAAASDLGSPGRIHAPPVPPRLQVSREANALRIAFGAAVGYRYWLEVRDESDWNPTGEEYVATADGSAVFTSPITAAARFFRVGVE